MTDELTLALRSFNAFGCALAMGLWLTGDRHGVAWWSIMLWLIGGLASSVEGIIQDNPIGIRTVLTTIAVAATIRLAAREVKEAQR